MYGPLWICITLIIEMLIIGHLSKMLNIELGWGASAELESADKELIEKIVQRYGGVSPILLDPSSANANEALQKVARITFIVMAYFILTPLACTLTFASSHAIQTGTQKHSPEISFTRFTQTYAYSMACFIPAVALYVVCMPWSRAQMAILIAAVAMSSFY